MTETTPQDFLKKHKNQTVRDMFALLEKELAPLAELQERVKKASPPPVSELDKELAESEEPQVVEFRKAIERIEEQLRVAREDAHKFLLSRYKTLSSDELEALRNEYGQQATRARKAWGMLHDFSEMMPNTDGVKEALEQIRIPNFRNFGNTTGRTALGDGGPRPKVSKVTIKRADGQVKSDERISSLAIWSKLKTKDIYEVWFKTAGVEQWQDIKDTHTFKVGECEVTIEPYDNGDSEE